jgi:vacuolar-type H+-ATPase subunit H
MSKLVKTYFFSKGAEGALETNVNLSKDEKRKARPTFKNDGTSLIVRNLNVNTTVEKLQSRVENCIAVEIHKKVINDETQYYAFMSFPTTTKAFEAKCALHDNKLDDNVLKVENKRSREDIIEEQQEIRRLQREAERKAEREAEKEINKQRKQALKEAENIIKSQPATSRTKQNTKPNTQNVQVSWICHACKTHNKNGDRCEKCQTRSFAASIRS